MSMLKILTTTQIRMADEFTIQHKPISSLNLMELASKKLYLWIGDYININRPVYIFTGPGNNGGDGLALARMLLENGYLVEVFMLNISNSLSRDAEINLQRFSQIGKSKISKILNENQFPVIPKGSLIVDALFGSGLKKPLDGLALRLVNYLNSTDEEILAIDIPSGLFGEDNRDNLPGGIICATNTLTFQFPKLAFFFAENRNFTGEWHVLDIGLHKEFISKVETDWYYCSKPEVAGLIKKRKKFDHKGIFGHALLLSGSKGKTGAAILSALACLKSGCGLVTAHIPASAYEILQVAIPEVMCSVDSNKNLIGNLPELSGFDAIGIGPGIGTHQKTASLLKKLLLTIRKPLVIDADGINILAENKDLVNLIPENTILTPHPGEFDRLAGKSQNGYERFLKQIDFAKHYKITVVLKGAFTSIATPNGKVYFNTTGNNGMATAGSGDVLTGIILSLLAQDYTPVNAAITGVYLHGLAGDIALEIESHESLIAGNIIEHIGFAFKDLSV